MNIEINNDKPTNEDRLGRTKFVNKLYNLIINSEDILKENSLTIDINGKWGDGKTSVINLLKKKFNNSNDNKYKFIDFNAWEYSNKTDLTNILIDTLNYETENKFNRFFNNLKNNTIKHYNKFVPWINWIITILIFIFWICEFFKAKWVNTISTIITSSYIFHLLNEDRTMVLINKIKNFSYKKIQRIENKEKNITDIKEEAKDILLKQDKTFIVVIDDFDRLNKEEVCKLISFIKSNLDLPKFIFIFLYDREIINKILLREYEDPKFLEKIVTCQLDLPQIRQEYLEKFLEEGIKKIFNEIPDNNTRRSYYSLQKELYPHYFTNIRKVKRFLNQLNTDYRMLTNVDIDNIHFLFIEIVKHFEYKLYELIRDNKEKCLRKPDVSDEEMEEFKKKIQQNIKNSKIIDIMKNIFPQIYHKLSIPERQCINHSYSNKINNNYSFCKYFQLDNNIEKITKSEYNDLKQSFDNIYKFIGKLKQLPNKKIINTKILNINMVHKFIHNLEKLANKKINNAKKLNLHIDREDIVDNFRQLFLFDKKYFDITEKFIYNTKDKNLLISIYCISMICNIYNNSNHNDFYLKNYNEIFNILTELNILKEKKYLIYLTFLLERYLGILTIKKGNTSFQNYIDNLPKFINSIFTYFINDMNSGKNIFKNDYEHINSIRKLLGNLFYYKDLGYLLLKPGITENIFNIFNKFKEFIYNDEINKFVACMLIKLVINCIKNNQTIKNDLFYIIKHNNTLFEKSEIEEELKNNNLLEEFNNYNIN